jgi:hypothetical protein
MSIEELQEKLDQQIKQNEELKKQVETQTKSTDYYRKEWNYIADRFREHKKTSEASHKLQVEGLEFIIRKLERSEVGNLLKTLKRKEEEYNKVVGDLKSRYNIKVFDAQVECIKELLQKLDKFKKDKEKVERENYILSDDMKLLEKRNNNLKLYITYLENSRITDETYLKLKHASNDKHVLIENCLSKYNHLVSRRKSGWGDEGFSKYVRYDYEENKEKEKTENIEFIKDMDHLTKISEIDKRESLPLPELDGESDELTSEASEEDSNAE